MNNKGLRVAFIGTFSDSTVNGVENSGYHLAQELIYQGIEVYFYYVSDQTLPFTDSNKIQHRAFEKTSLSFWLPLSFRHYIQNNPDNIDVFHFHSVFIPRHFLISSLLTKNKIPYIITPHGGYILKALERTLRRHYLVKKFYIQFIEKALIKRAKALIALTWQEERDLRRFGYRGSIYVIPNTVPCVTDFADEIKANQQTILFLGRFDVSHKGLLFLLDIFRHVAARLVHVQLILHGMGKDEPLLRKKIETDNIPRVSIRKPVYGKDKALALQDCTLYCQPSQFEAFGVSIAEAMLAGKPVAITKECYLAPLLRQHGLGLMLPETPALAADAIINFLNDPDALVREGSALRQVALAEFNGKKVADETIQVYRKVVKGKISAPNRLSSLVQLDAV